MRHYQLVLFSLVAALLPGLCLAQSTARYKKGQEVDVLSGREWVPGKVVNTNRRMVTVELESGGVRQFTANQARYRYEANALAPSRFWSDASGGFRVRAAIVGVTDDSVVLRKTDLKEITVPIKRLSESDQKFIDRLQSGEGSTAAPPTAAPMHPKLETFGRSTQEWSPPDLQRVALPPDPLPSYAKLKQGGVGFPADFFDRLSAVLPLGGKGSLLLAAVEPGRPGQDASPTRLLWASLSAQKIVGQQLLPPGETVLDYHPSSLQLLTYSTGKSGPGFGGTPALSMWKLLPKDRAPKPIVRWNVSSGEMVSSFSVPWARIVNANVVLHKWNRQEYVGWDIAAKAIRYHLPQESFHAPPAALSGGRKYLFVPESRQVTIVDTATGQLIGMLPAVDGAGGVAVSEDGARVAVLGRSKLSVWNLGDASSPPRLYRAEAIGSGFSTTLNWVGDKRLMADQSPGFGKILFSLEKGASLWNYQFDPAAVGDRNDGRRVRDVVNEHLVYGAAVSQRGNRVLAVGAVRLPGPNVNDAEATLDPDDMDILKPGAPVRLQVNCGQHTARVQAALEQKIAANQWVLSPSATPTLIAEMGQYESQRVTYIFHRTGRRETVTVSPLYSTLRVQVGDQVVWRSGTSSGGAPSMIRLEQGETAQSRINKGRVPKPEFYDTVNIPARLIDPAKRNGVGTTNVTTRGLEPQ